MGLSRRSVVLLALSLAAASIMLVLATWSAAQSPPEYYVDGARPKEHSGSISESAIDEACVPYSADRPTAMVCGDLPEDFRIGDPPGVYPEVCQLARSKYGELKDSDATRLIDGSCFVIPQPSSSSDPKIDAEYHVKWETEDGVGVTILLDVDTGHATMIAG
jgi:hypothetical protein